MCDLCKFTRSLLYGVLVGGAAAFVAFVAGIPSDGGALANSEAPTPSAGPSAELVLYPRSADSASIDPTVGATAYILRLSESDANAALAELALIEQPKSRRDAALALLDVLGRNQDGIARVASALPLPDRMNFVFDAIAGHAAENLQEAIEFALELDGTAARTEAVIRIAKVLAGRNPRIALSGSAAIDNYQLADAYKAAVFKEWARIDPDGFLAFIETAPASDVLAADSEAFQIAALSDPGRLLTLIDEIPQAVRSTAERAALEASIRTDRNSGFTYIDAMPAGDARDHLLAFTARSFALHDLDGLAWLDSRQPPEASATMAVLQVLTEADPVRAVDVLIANLIDSGRIDSGSNTAQLGFESVLSSFTPGAREDLSIVADRLSAVDDSVVRSAYDQFFYYWSRNDAEAAHDWAVANVDRLTRNSLAYLARSLTGERPDLAKQAASRIPPDMQSLWILTVAEQLARDDLEGALQWLSGYRGQPVYEGALEAALRGVSSGGSAANPESVALFLDRQSPEMRADSVPMVANLWARQDPRAAARWVQSIMLDPAEERRRDAALSNVASQWAAQDPESARDWALELPQDERRDQVLASLLRVTTQAGFVDNRVIDAFSSDDARQRTLANTMRSLGASDPDLGRELINRYIDDPTYREQAEEQLILGASNDPTGLSNMLILQN